MSRCAGRSAAEIHKAGRESTIALDKPQDSTKIGAAPGKRQVGEFRLRVFLDGFVLSEWPAHHICSYIAMAASPVIHGRVIERCACLGRHKFLITYPDGSKKHVGTAERNSLLLSREIQPLTAKAYKFTGETKTFTSFTALGQWFQVQALSPEQLRRYLSNLAVLYDLAGEKELQLEETPEAFGLRLEQIGCKPLTPA